MACCSELQGTTRPTPWVPYQHGQCYGAVNLRPDNAPYPGPQPVVWTLTSSMRVGNGVLGRLNPYTLPSHPTPPQPEGEGKHYSVVLVART